MAEGSLCIRKTVFKKSVTFHVTFEMLLKFELNVIIYRENSKIQLLTLSLMHPSAVIGRSCFLKKIALRTRFHSCKTFKWLLMKVSQSNLGIYTFPYLYFMSPAAHVGILYCFTVPARTGEKRE